MSVNPRLWRVTVIVEDDNVADPETVKMMLEMSVRALLLRKQRMADGGWAVPFFPDELLAVTVEPVENK